ncbi:histone lysine methyltransferase set8 [Cystoisospora suis]|uniref:Histone lysine methyltransferase set8 n=1 Tax=Cystoisospora suis TaxID=483139 RepID=A0A2C6L096_9APIC|nr:histone lysine methyltransferase set8 [Cystoisospora suis]
MRETREPSNEAKESEAQKEAREDFIQATPEVAYDTVTQKMLHPRYIAEFLAVHGRQNRSSPSPPSSTSSSESNDVTIRHLTSNDKRSSSVSSTSLHEPNASFDTSGTPHTTSVEVSPFLQPVFSSEFSRGGGEGVSQGGHRPSHQYHPRPLPPPVQQQNHHEKTSSFSSDYCLLPSPMSHARSPPNLTANGGVLLSQAISHEGSHAQETHRGDRSVHRYQDRSVTDRHSSDACLSSSQHLSVTIPALARQENGPQDLERCHPQGQKADSRHLLVSTTPDERRDITRVPPENRKDLSHLPILTHDNTPSNQESTHLLPHLNEPNLSVSSSSSATALASSRPHHVSSLSRGGVCPAAKSLVKPRRRQSIHPPASEPSSVSLSSSHITTAAATSTTTTTIPTPSSSASSIPSSIFPVSSKCTEISSLHDKKGSDLIHSRRDDLEAPLSLSPKTKRGLDKVSLVKENSCLAREGKEGGIFSSSTLDTHVKEEDSQENKRNERVEEGETSIRKPLPFMGHHSTLHCNKNPSSFTAAPVFTLPETMKDTKREGEEKEEGLSREGSEMRRDMDSLCQEEREIESRGEGESLIEKLLNQDQSRISLDLHSSTASSFLQGTSSLSSSSLLAQGVEEQTVEGKGDRGGLRSSDERKLQHEGNGSRGEEAEGRREEEDRMRESLTTSSMENGDMTMTRGEKKPPSQTHEIVGVPQTKKKKKGREVSPCSHSPSTSGDHRCRPPSAEEETPSNIATAAESSSSSIGGGDIKGEEEGEASMKKNSSRRRETSKTRGGGGTWGRLKKKKNTTEDQHLQEGTEEISKKRRSRSETSASSSSSSKKFKGGGKDDSMEMSSTTTSSTSSSSSSSYLVEKTPSDLISSSSCSSSGGGVSTHHCDGAVHPSSSTAATPPDESPCREIVEEDLPDSYKDKSPSTFSLSSSSFTEKHVSSSSLASPSPPPPHRSLFSPSSSSPSHRIRPLSRLHSHQHRPTVARLSSSSSPYLGCASSSSSSSSSGARKKISSAKRRKNLSKGARNSRTSPASSSSSRIGSGGRYAQQHHSPNHRPSVGRFSSSSSYGMLNSGGRMTGTGFACGGGGGGISSGSTSSSGSGDLSAKVRRLVEQTMLEKHRIVWIERGEVKGFLPLPGMKEERVYLVWTEKGLDILADVQAYIPWTHCPVLMPARQRQKQTPFLILSSTALSLLFSQVCRRNSTAVFRLPLRRTPASYQKHVLHLLRTPDEVSPSSSPFQETGGGSVFSSSGNKRTSSRNHRLSSSPGVPTSRSVMKTSSSEKKVKEGRGEEATISHGRTKDDLSSETRPRQQMLETSSPSSSPSQETSSLAEKAPIDGDTLQKCVSTTTTPASHESIKENNSLHTKGEGCHLDGERGEGGGKVSSFQQNDTSLISGNDLKDGTQDESKIMSPPSSSLPPSTSVAGLESSCTSLTVEKWMKEEEREAKKSSFQAQDGEDLVKENHLIKLEQEDCMHKMNTLPSPLTTMIPSLSSSLSSSFSSYFSSLPLDTANEEGPSQSREDMAVTACVRVNSKEPVCTSSAETIDGMQSAKEEEEKKKEEKENKLVSCEETLSESMGVLDVSLPSLDGDRWLTSDEARERYALEKEDKHKKEESLLLSLKKEDDKESWVGGWQHDNCRGERKQEKISSDGEQVRKEEDHERQEMTNSLPVKSLLDNESREASPSSSLSCSAPPSSCQGEMCRSENLSPEEVSSVYPQTGLSGHLKGKENEEEENVELKTADESEEKSEAIDKKREKKNKASFSSSSSLISLSTQDNKASLRASSSSSISSSSQSPSLRSSSSAPTVSQSSPGQDSQGRNEEEEERRLDRNASEGGEIRDSEEKKKNRNDSSSSLSSTTPAAGAPADSRGRSVDEGNFFREQESEFCSMSASSSRSSVATASARDATTSRHALPAVSSGGGGGSSVNYSHAKRGIQTSLPIDMKDFYCCSQGKVVGEDYVYFRQCLPDDEGADVYDINLSIRKRPKKLLLKKSKFLSRLAASSSSSSFGVLSSKTATGESDVQDESSRSRGEGGLSSPSSTVGLAAAQDSSNVDARESILFNSGDRLQGFDHEGGRGSQGDESTEGHAEQTHAPSSSSQARAGEGDIEKPAQGDRREGEMTTMNDKNQKSAVPLSPEDVLKSLLTSPQREEGKEREGGGGTGGDQNTVVVKRTVWAYVDEYEDDSMDSRLDLPVAYTSEMKVLLGLAPSPTPHRCNSMSLASHRVSSVAQQRFRMFQCHPDSEEARGEELHPYEPLPPSSSSSTSCSSARCSDAEEEEGENEDEKEKTSDQIDASSSVTQETGEEEKEEGGEKKGGEQEGKREEKDTKDGDEEHKEEEKTSEEDKSKEQGKEEKEEDGGEIKNEAAEVSSLDEDKKRNESADKKNSKTKQQKKKKGEKEEGVSEKGVGDKRGRKSNDVLGRSRDDQKDKKEQEEEEELTSGPVAPQLDSQEEEERDRARKKKKE